MSKPDANPGSPPAGEAARWRRKKWEESQRDHRRRQRARFNPLGPLALALGAAGIVCVASILIGSPRWNRPPLKPGDAVAMFPFLAGLLFVLLYVLRIVVSGRARFELLICPSCFEVYVRAKADLACRACGTLLENADGWTYNRCPRCDYDLRGAAGARGRCPECGARAFLLHV